MAHFMPWGAPWSLMRNSFKTPQGHQDPIIVAVTKKKMKHDLPGVLSYSVLAFQYFVKKYIMRNDTVVFTIQFQNNTPEWFNALHMKR